MEMVQTTLPSPNDEKLLENHGDELPLPSAPNNISGLFGFFFFH